MPREISVYRFAIVNTGDVRLPALCPAPELDPAFLTSVRTHGVLVPILVRPSVRALVAQEGRLGAAFGYFLIDSRRLGQGSHYRGRPPWLPTRAALEAAVPWRVRWNADYSLGRPGDDVPYEVVAGEGCRRLAAAKVARLRHVPCVIGGLDDDEAAEICANS